jgi:hypothetical protein
MQAPYLATGQTDRGLTMVSKAFYEDKLNNALSVFNGEIERLTAEADPAKQQFIEEYRERVSQIEGKLEQLAEAGKEEESLWKKFLGELDDILSKMGAGFENISARNETDATIGSHKKKDE